MCRKSSNIPPTDELRNRIDTLVASSATKTIHHRRNTDESQNAEHQTRQRDEHLGARSCQAQGVHQLEYQVVILCT